MQEKIKARRNLAYLMNNFNDVGLSFSYIDNNIVETVTEFFETASSLIYPAKSYFVAIVYAKCLEKYFQVDFLEALNDKELLPDDLYFKSYSEDKETYDKIFALLKNKDILSLKSSQKTVNYFKQEFLVED